MFEKVNPSHPDKIADRIAGAMVDLAYTHEHDPKVAVEVLIGHGVCTIIAESSYDFKVEDVEAIVKRIAGDNITTNLTVVKQDSHLAQNQADGLRCGDNGIFKGTPVTDEQDWLTTFAQELYLEYPTDGKFVIDNDRLLTVCQSCANSDRLFEDCQQLIKVNTRRGCPEAFHVHLFPLVNPLGDWTGGLDVDTGATNRKLGSDMGDAVTGGGLHGKDLSKADVSVNIFAHLLANFLQQPVELSCSIGDKYIGPFPYSTIVDIARDYVNNIGGFEKLAEWGLISG